MTQSEKIFMPTEERDEKGIIPTLTREEYNSLPSMVQNQCVCSVKFSNDGRTATVTKANGEKFDKEKDAELLETSRKYFQNLVNKNRNTTQRDVVFEKAQRSSDAMIRLINKDETIMNHAKTLFSLMEEKRNKKGEVEYSYPIIAMKIVAIKSDDNEIKIASSFDKDASYMNAPSHKVGRIFQTKRDVQVVNIYAPVQNAIAEIQNPSE